MFRRFFRHSSDYGEAEGSGEKENRKRYFAVIVIIVVAICFLAFGGEGEKGKKQKNESTEKVKLTSEQNFENYIFDSENRLKNILSEIEGAGDVRVMLSFNNINEKVLAKNSKREENLNSDDEKNTTSRGYEENVLIYGMGAEEQPYVLKEKLPDPAGVLVLAEGAGDEKVRLEIYEAVKALYGVSGHRVKIAQLLKK